MIGHHHHRRARHRGLGHGHGPFRGRRCGLGREDLDREAWIARLEEHQRDLEQDVADTADLLRRLREEAPPAGEPAPTQV